VANSRITLPGKAPLGVALGSATPPNVASLLGGEILFAPTRPMGSEEVLRRGRGWRTRGSPFLGRPPSASPSAPPLPPMSLRSWGERTRLSLASGRGELVAVAPSLPDVAWLLVARSCLSPLDRAERGSAEEGARVANSRITLPGKAPLGVAFGSATPPNVASLLGGEILFAPTRPMGSEEVLRRGRGWRTRGSLLPGKGPLGVAFGSATPPNVASLLGGEILGKPPNVAAPGGRDLGEAPQRRFAPGGSGFGKAPLGVAFGSATPPNVASLLGGENSSVPREREGELVAVAPSLPDVAWLLVARSCLSPLDRAERGSLGGHAGRSPARGVVA
jgi:hypothetical protein